jgi:hypothetical protein
MSYKNIDAQLSDDDKNTIVTKLREIEALIPFAIKLSTNDRKSLSKMGKKTIGFVSSSLGVAKNQPQYVPNYIDLARKTQDMELAMQLVDVMDVLGPLYEMMRDTLTVAGAEAYLSARVIYDTVKVAVKSGLPGSEVISKDLGSIFKKPRKPSPDTGDTDTTDPIDTDPPVKKKKAA